jgi:thioesterase domain-containing protein
MTTTTPFVSSLVNDYRRLSEIRAELREMLKREGKRHEMDADHFYQEMLEEVIALMDNYIDYDPTPNEPGEPPMTASEMHDAAWREHQEAHR